MSAGYDAIVVGAGVNGLVAAAYLARARKRVLVLESSNHLGGLCETARLGEAFKVPRGAHAFYALDPKMLADLQLAKHGLKFAVRDMPLVALRADGKHLVLGRDARAAARAIAVHSRPDGDAWPHFRRELFSLSRDLRALWWNDGTVALPAEIAGLERLSLSAWLDAAFESDALKAALASDATALSPLAPGGPLLSLWRASQEMSGSQATAAMTLGGPGVLIDALAKVTRSLGVEIRTGARVTDFVVNEGMAAGVVAAPGDTIAAKIILASISPRQFLATKAGRAALGIAEAATIEIAAPKIASAKVTLALNAAPSFNGIAVPLRGRFIIADRVESFVTAHAAARAGRLPEELTLEVVFPTAADPSLAPVGQHVVSMLIRPLPRNVIGGWDAAKAQLAARAIAALERFSPGLARKVVAADVLTPEDIAERYGTEDEFGGLVSVARMVSGWRSRISTSVEGLYLCGASSEPVGAISGRAGRISAAIALRAEIAP